MPQGKSCFARLMVERGAPYEKGMCFPLQQNEVLLGRATNQFKPDISFDSLLISRKHCCISHLDGIWSIADLGSKHGTWLNGQPLEPHRPFTLRHGDNILLAASIVLIRFTDSPEFERTLDFESTQSLHTINKVKSDLPIVINIEKKALYINNSEVPLSVKEWCLLELLYEHRNKLVNYSDIRKSVWTERSLLGDGVPDVGFDEMNILLYRLRRKLGHYRSILKTRRGQGCLLEIKETES